MRKGTPRTPVFDDLPIAVWDTAFNDLYCCVAPYFRRTETRERGRRYVFGLLSRAERKNSWQLAETMHEPGPQGMQRLLTTAQWDVDGVRDALQAYVIDHLSVPDGVLVLDETGFLKKGTKSAGVARQYSGTAGRIENCQVGVFLAYASPSGYAFLDRALYVPEEWMQDRARCRAAGIPDSVTFATKTQLAQQMLGRAHETSIPAQWVVADTVYSGDDLRLWLEAHGYWYVLAVSCTYSIWTAGRAVEAAALAADLSAEAWVKLSAGRGSKGDRIYEWAWLQLPYNSPTDMCHWLVIRRSTSTPHDYAYYHAYAPAEITLADLVHVAGTRWVIESGFEQAKGEVGLDHYEVRQWLAWYRHITLALLAHTYLAVVRTMLPEPAPDMVGISVPEVRRLREGLAGSEAERAHRLRWSAWRRRHQAQAQQCHRQRRPDGAVMDRTTLPCAVILPGIGVLTELGWSKIEAFLPVRRSHLGRPNIPHRQLLEGMIAVMQMGVSWRNMPTLFGPWQTVYDRYAEWVKKGIWAQIVAILGVVWASGP